MEAEAIERVRVIRVRRAELTRAYGMLEGSDGGAMLDQGWYFQ